jgi:hypothetical protein
MERNEKSLEQGGGNVWGFVEEMEGRGKLTGKGMTELEEKLGRIILWREGELGM